MAGRRGDENSPRRARRRAKGLPNWRIVRYADDFVILVHGTGQTPALARRHRPRAGTPGPEAVTSQDPDRAPERGLDFLGFRIQWHRKRGTSKWYVYVFIAGQAIRSLKDKIRALTRRTSQQPPRDALIRLNQIMRGWAHYFKPRDKDRTVLLN